VPSPIEEPLAPGALAVPAGVLLVETMSLSPPPHPITATDAARKTTPRVYLLNWYNG